MKIGFIGLGIMGSRMAANLFDGGYELVVYNRTGEKAASLLQRGAVWADSPAAVAEQVDVLFTMVADPRAVEAVAFGQDGLLEALPENGLWIDCSTVNPSFTVRMALEASQHGVRFVDAPVGGSRDIAAAGELLFFVGGHERDVEEARPYLEVMGARTVHVGAIGLGTGMKMLFNAMIATSIAAFSEVAVLGEELGIDREMVFETLLNSPVAAPFLKEKRKDMLNGGGDTHFPLKHMQKDLHLAATTAYEQHAAAPVSNAVKEVFAMAHRAGRGDEDYAAVYNFLRMTQRTD